MTQVTVVHMTSEVVQGLQGTDGKNSLSASFSRHFQRQGNEW